MTKRKVESQTASLTPDQKKSGIDPIYLAIAGVWHIIDLDESYNFASNHISIWGLLVKLWFSKVAGVPTSVISGLPLGRKKSFGCRLRGQP
jgi:hypothetical protein